MSLTILIGAHRRLWIESPPILGENKPLGLWAIKLRYSSEVSDLESWAAHSCVKPVLHPAYRSQWAGEGWWSITVQIAGGLNSSGFVRFISGWKTDTGPGSRSLIFYQEVEDPPTGHCLLVEELDCPAGGEMTHWSPQCHCWFLNPWGWIVKWQTVVNVLLTVAKESSGRGFPLHLCLCVATGQTEMDTVSLLVLDSGGGSKRAVWEVWSVVFWQWSQDIGLEDLHLSVLGPTDFSYERVLNGSHANLQRQPVCRGPKLFLSCVIVRP